jgi:hypothetical protein
MEHLVLDLKEKLILRRKSEMNRLQELDKEDDKVLILISSGKIFELDFLINYIEEMINYFEKTKEIQK